MSDSKTAAISYGNFQNPLGLVYRMLKSGQRAAWAALFREVLGIAAKPIDAVLQFKERKSIETAKTGDLPLLLIVGPPRCGTTLVYQVMSYCLDVSYPTNLGSMFPKSPMTVNGLAGKVRADFQSFYGQTARMSGCNDAFHLWNRWLGDDRYVTRTDLSEEQRNEMRKFFGAWSERFGKPILNKNNRNVHCTDYLANALPQARFVGVFRDPVCVARSLIRARQTVQGDRKIGWGLQCQESHCYKDDLGYVQDVCDQVRRNEADLRKQLDGLNDDRVIRIQYEAFCKKPDESVDQLIAQIPGLKLRPGTARLGAQAFDVSQSGPLSPAEEQILNRNFRTAESVLTSV
ncbi:MAG: sulfotransferase [Fuerstiella sp.]